MAYSRKHYRSFICTAGSGTCNDGRRTTSSGAHQPRGGNPGHAVDTGFGTPGNLHRSQHKYPGKG